METSADKLARDLLRLDDLDGASRVTEDEIRRVEDHGGNPEIWRFRFVRAEIMRLRGHAEEALKYLEGQGSLYPPEASDAESLIGLLMHTVYCCGLLRKYHHSHLLPPQPDDKPAPATL